jgi:hypothetical protein
MNEPEPHPNVNLTPLALTWLALVALTLVSLGLGEWLGRASWLPTLVAAIIWLKAWLVAFFFLETRLCHTLIRRLIWAFIAFAPVALVLTDLFGQQFAALVQI